MNFFPNLQPNIKDDLDTSNMNFDKTKVPSLPPVGYYANKIYKGLDQNVNGENFKKNIENVCNKTWVCNYENIAFGTYTNTLDTNTNTYLFKSKESTDTGTNDTTIISKFNTVFSQKQGSTPVYGPIDLTFLNNMTNILCQLPNIMIMLGYEYKSANITSNSSDKPFDFGYTNSNPINVISNYDLYLKKAVKDPKNSNKILYRYPVIYLKKNATLSTPSTNQAQFNACQTVMSRTRMYNAKDLLMGGLFYGIKDVFIKLKQLKPLLLIILVLSIYLLVQGTFSSADIAFKIASLVSNRSVPSTSFIIGILLGIGIPAIMSIIISQQQIKKTNNKFGSYDITKSPYGQKVDTSSTQQKSDILLITIMLGLAYTFIFIIYYVMRDRNNSPIVKLGITAIFYILLTCIIFLIFYWAPIVSYANDAEDDRAFGLSRPLKVWTKGDNPLDISTVMSNKYIDRYLRRYFAIYALVSLAICIIYLSQSNTQQTGLIPSLIEGIMASCAIIALPILWIFNWFAGVKFFIGYPMVLMIVRYFRYPMYYLLRSYYMSNPKLQSECAKLKEEFNHPESYTAPWDLMGVTLFKYLIKMFCNKSLYSDLFVDYKDGYRDISGNAYVTGHVFRIMMKDRKGPYDYYHHGLVFIITIIVVLFLIFNVIGKENAF